MLSRRKSPRLPVTGWSVWGEAGDRGASMPLVNLSENGALVLSPVDIREGESLYLYLEDHEPVEWIDARVVRVVIGPQFHQLHLSFGDKCPESTFETATGGPHPFVAWGEGRSPFEGSFLLPLPASCRH